MKEDNHTDSVLNPEQCCIRSIEGKGRGVFATRPIPAQTVIETSPVLLFTREEYNHHGKHTLLDHYTFNWKDGRMALALGLGSIFNHSGKPNVSFVVDSAGECIRYIAARAIEPDEELCIFYGHKLWFDPIDAMDASSPTCSSEDTDPWGGLGGIQGHTTDNTPNTSLESQPKIDDSEIVDEDDLPFTWKKLSLDKEEEQLDDIELVRAWVVDIPNQKHIAGMLKWLKQSGLDKDALSHLKRIRRQDTSCTLLLDTSPDSPALPTVTLDLDLPPPYQLPVPVNPALTPTSLQLKNTFWPTVFAPKRKWEPETWTRGKTRWASNAIHLLKQACVNASTHCELSIVAYVPIPYDDDTQLPRPFIAHDTRISTRHPLRHATLNIIRDIADFRAEQPIGTSTSTSSSDSDETAKNGAQYLLTGLTLFITHEPCIMCTMALLHSRVKDVFYLVPMPKTGGCGGVTCVPSLKGVNHRFSIGIWKVPRHTPDDPTLDADIDV